MEVLKHECGVAMVRLLKPLEYYKRKYGTWHYGLDKLYLLMEKQHNRGQEGAGLGVVKLHAQPGNEYVFRERALGKDAIQEIFESVNQSVATYFREDPSPEDVESLAPFLGEIYLGHLRYSTTGKSGLSYCHPFLRRNNWRSRSLLMCGNFNMTNVDEIFAKVVEHGQHPRIYGDTVILLEQLGEALDKENHRIYRQYRQETSGKRLSHIIEENLDVRNMLSACAPSWDGGYVICGAVGSGDMFALRDPHGIRPAFYYKDDEVVVLASERPVIQTVFNLHASQIKELEPGAALVVKANGETAVSQLLEPGKNERCSFERIYFSRGSDCDIYRERKQLGANLVPAIMRSIGGDLRHSVFSFIPNTAEVAFLGMTEGLEQELAKHKMAELTAAQANGTITTEQLSEIMSQRLRVEKVVIKDIKLRTFITEGASRNDLAAHVYDVTYGIVEPGVDNLVVIDDSIVRGTTLKQSILTMLSRLKPRKIVVVSSSPQVRYPDYYGIDMSRLSEFIAFRATVELLHERGMEHVLEETYRNCLAQKDAKDSELKNCVKAIYEPFSQEEISRKMAEMLTADGSIDSEVEIIYQSLDGLHEAIANHPGDWYFSGDYPTPGGTRLVNQAFINYYESQPYLTGILR